MPTLELTLQRKTDSGYPIIAALTRPGGFLPLRREGTLTLDIPALAEFQYDPLAYGTALGQALFVDEIRDTFVKALGDEPLRVLLSIEAPDLRALDWHRLAAPFDGRWRCLAAQQNTPFSLAVPSPASAHFPAIGRHDLRALLLVAGPESLSGDYKLAPFDVAATIASIQEALGNIPYDILPAPSLDALCTTLTRGVEPVETKTPYTLLHLVCHGAVNERGETILYFPKDEKRGPTPASDLLDRLASLARLPHFVFLSACESALPQNGLGSLAQRLVRELGLPAVLAMTDRVSIATAGAIAAPFYAQLYQHGQPDLALAESLAGLQGRPDVTVPALLSRLSDRPLFDDNTERPLTEQELEFGLAKLAESLSERAPVMESLRDALTRRLRSKLGAEVQSLSESRHTERTETLSALNSLSLEALDISFNALCLGQTPPAYDSRSPFRGLESFRPEDAEYFFGREALTRKLVQRLNEHNFLAVLGASGSGKSSLVMAGLIPALNVPYAIFRPGMEPLGELEKTLQADPALIVVDQFEELFTLSAREQRAEFITRLLEQSKSRRVVVTLRADFLGEVAPFKSLKDEVENHQVIIPPMDEAELRRAMEGQAGYAGLRFESDLSQQMLDDVSGEPGAMPLLQHALWTLWTRRHGRWLRAEEYRAFGGVRQAIASTAEAVYARCTEFERERLRDIFLRLTRLDESADGRDTRRRVLLSDLIPADSEPTATTLLIKQLADARLVVVTGDEVEVAHEALIRHWERLRTWLNDDRDNLRLSEGVSDDARRWENAERDESLLNHRGPRLELTLAMSKNPRYRLNPVEQAYLNGCVGLREKEKAAAARRRRFATTGISSALIVIMAILAGWGWTSSQNTRQLETQVKIADQQRIIALARQLAAQAQSIRVSKEYKQQLAVLLALRSIQLFPTLDAVQILQTNTLLKPNVLVFHSGQVNSIDFSPDEKYLVTGDEEGLIHLALSATGVNVMTFHHDGPVYVVAFSPDGRFIVSASADHTARVWECATGREVARMTHGDEVLSAVFSKNGKYVATSSKDGTARVWDPFSGTEISRMVHESTVVNVAISPNNDWVVSDSHDGTARVWKLETGEEIARMRHTSLVQAIAISPNGEYIASENCANYDMGLSCVKDEVIVWKALSGKVVASLDHNNWIRAIVFSPDSRYVTSGGDDGIIKILDINVNLKIAEIKHDSAVTSIAYSGNGKYLVSGSVDGTARLWDNESHQLLGQQAHYAWVPSVAISPTGRLIGSVGSDGSVQITEYPDHEEKVQVEQSGFVDSIFFSPDSQYFFSVTSQGGTNVLNVKTKMAVADFHFDGFSKSVTVSADGRYLAGGGRDGIVHVYEVATKKEIVQMSVEKTFWYDNSFSPDGHSIVSVDMDGKAVVWGVATGEKIFDISANSTVVSAQFSPDDQFLVTENSDSTLRIYEAGSGKAVARFQINKYINVLAFSPDGKYLAIGNADSNIHILELFSGNEISQMKQDGRVGAMAFSPDSNWLVVGAEDWTARVWEVKSGLEISRMLHDGSVIAVAFSPDNTYVISGSQDRTARIWEALTGKEIGRNTQKDVITAVTFSPDGLYAAAAYCDKRASTSICDHSLSYFWVYRPEDLHNEACRYVNRNLTRAEWKAFIGDFLPYQAVCSNLPIEPEPTTTPTP